MLELLKCEQVEVAEINCGVRPQQQPSEAQQQTATIEVSSHMVQEVDRQCVGTVGPDCEVATKGQTAQSHVDIQFTPRCLDDCQSPFKV